MSRFGVTRVLLIAAIGIVLILHLVASPEPGIRNFEILPEMVDAVPYESQGSNPNFEDGSTQRLPAPGSAAIGYPAFRYQPTPEDALRAGLELKSPLNADDREALSRGAFVYRTFCHVCHGGDGGGQGPMTKRGVPPPPSLLAERARTMKDGQMYHILALGQGNMASYASQVERQDRWKVILHLRSLQRATKKGSQQ